MILEWSRWSPIGTPSKEMLQDKSSLINA